MRRAVMYPMRGLQVLTGASSHVALPLIWTAMLKGEPGENGNDAKHDACGKRDDDHRDVLQ